MPYASVDVKLQFEEDVKEQLEKALKTDERFQDMLIVAGADSPDEPAGYAVYLEFGTGGSTAKYDPKNSYKKRGSKSPVLEKYEEWVEMKFGLKGKECEKTARSIYHYHMSSGMPPSPFFRPGIHNIQHMLEQDPEWWMRENGSMEKIARLMTDEMKSILEKNGSIMSGDVYDSIDYMPAQGEMPTGITETIDPAVMASDEMDFKGDTQRYRRAQSRRNH